ncbi:hypothetical protein [Dactylosporangium sp. NPDC051541]|uniref:hypothetical protein n=1 Tax=Dactylosporangium sp. NPDC051541 TaxID=3363977 RepID=UPI0037BC2EA2
MRRSRRATPPSPATVAAAATASSTRMPAGSAICWNGPRSATAAGTPSSGPSSASVPPAASGSQARPVSLGRHPASSAAPPAMAAVAGHWPQT